MSELSQIRNDFGYVKIVFKPFEPFVYQTPHVEPVFVAKAAKFVKEKCKN